MQAVQALSYFNTLVSGHANPLQSLGVVVKCYFWECTAFSIMADQGSAQSTSAPRRKRFSVGKVELPAPS